MTTSALCVPAVLSFPIESCRQDAWGRMLELSGGHARLSTQMVLRRYERLTVAFELAGEAFKGLQAEVDWIERDADGYWVASLRWRDPVQRRRLSDALLDVLSRTA